MLQDSGVSVTSVDLDGIREHVRSVHNMGNMIEDAVIAPSLPNLAAIVCLNCRNNESARIWFSEEDAWHHIDTTHGKFFRKKLLSAACRLCDQVGPMSEIRSHVLQCRLGINFDNTVSEEERNDYSHLINIQSQPENRSDHRE